MNRDENKYEDGIPRQDALRKKNLKFLPYFTFQNQHKRYITALMALAVQGLTLTNI